MTSPVRLKGHLPELLEAAKDFRDRVADTARCPASTRKSLNRLDRAINNAEKLLGEIERSAEIQPAIYPTPRQLRQIQITDAVCAALVTLGALAAIVAITLGY